MDTRIELWLYPMSDVAFIQQIIHLDWDDFTDWQVVDFIDAYCYLKKIHWSEVIAQQEFVKNHSSLFKFFAS